jgi:RNA polymerase sigma-70 factor (ECF subfamily)
MEPQAKFSTALFGIARNLTLNFLRDDTRRGRNLTRSLTWEDDREHWVEDESRRPDREARVHEIDASITRALALLSPEHREIIILRELEGMDYEAIAEVVGCRKGTVKSRLARAREQLRLRLYELGGDLL